MSLLEYLVYHFEVTVPDLMDPKRKQGDNEEAKACQSKLDDIQNLLEKLKKIEMKLKKTNVDELEKGSTKELVYNSDVKTMKDGMVNTFFSLSFPPSPSSHELHDGTEKLESTIR